MSVRTPLTAEEVRAALAERTGWSGDTTGIEKTYHVEYHTGVAIVVDVAQAAIELEHHPDIDIRWDTLRFAITTHTAGDKVTRLDFLLADRIDAIAAGRGAGPSAGS
ncbi:MAG TPA: 4a-hydroxytetrahydrobiopterin dehydratase [Acidimicrobiales bacterium]